MQAGILKDKIDITRFDKVKNDYGEETISYTYIGSTRAGVINNPTSRTVINSEIQYPYTKNVVVRKYVDVKEDDWIKYKGKDYRILSIEENDTYQNKMLIVQLVNE